jgi:thiamine-phosphate pyrophosphorylase
VKGLYPIIDVETLVARGIDPLLFAERVLVAEPPILQLRSKSGSARATLELLRKLVPRCRAAKTLLFANDRPDLAVLAGADGVHLGQDDLPPEAARRFAPQLGLGLSTHNFDELDRALAHQPTYVAFGPVFSTGSKHNPEPVVGLEALAEASRRARARGIPLVAIGGIDYERAREVARHAELGAVIAALAGLELAQVPGRASELNAIFGAESRLSPRAS